MYDMRTKLHSVARLHVSQSIRSPEGVSLNDGRYCSSNRTLSVANRRRDRGFAAIGQRPQNASQVTKPAVDSTDVPKMTAFQGPDRYDS